MQFQYLLYAQPVAICVLSASCRALLRVSKEVCHGPQAVQVMTKICAESERSLDYYGLFKQIMKRAPVPMSPLESLASSAVRTAHKVCCLHCALPTRCVASSAVRIAHKVCCLCCALPTRYAASSAAHCPRGMLHPTQMLAESVHAMQHSSMVMQLMHVKPVAKRCSARLCIFW